MKDSIRLSHSPARILTTIILLLCITLPAIATTVVPFRNARVRVTDSVGTFTLNDKDSNIFNDSVSIDPDVAVGFNIDPIDATKPIVVAKPSPNGKFFQLKLTNIKVTATADNITGSLILDGIWDNTHHKSIIQSYMDGTTSFAYDPERPLDDYTVDFDADIAIDEIPIDVRTATTRLFPGGPFTVSLGEEHKALPKTAIPISLRLTFNFSKAGDAFTLPDSFVLNVIPTPSSATLGFVLLLTASLRRHRKLNH